MTEKRKVEVFVAGCPICEEAVATVKRLACPSCEVQVLDVNDTDVKRRADELGVRFTPAVAVDGKLADCCARGGVDEAALRRAGIGRAL